MTLERLWLRAWIEGLERQTRQQPPQPAAPGPLPVPAPRAPRA